MIPELTTEQVDDLKKLDIGLIYLFGSHAEFNDHPFSDIDIGIIFSNDSIIQQNTNNIYVQLYDLFTNIYPNKKVDIVFLQRAGLEICMDAINYGQILFSISDDFKFKFIEKTMLLYADFKPVLNEFDKAVLERI